MRTIFTAELHQLGDDLVAMSRLVERAVSHAGTALLTPDLGLAEAVIADDEAVDAAEADLDERCVHLLAQQQPVATDLRVVVSGLRISASLERMGDLARHVAQVARGRYPERALPEDTLEVFGHMQQAAERLAQRLTLLLDTHDLDVAAAIERDDDLLDALHERTFTAVLAADPPRSPQQAVDITLLARYYERFGDHGVSIAQRVTYLVTGTPARATEGF